MKNEFFHYIEIIPPAAIHAVPAAAPNAGRGRPALKGLPVHKASRGKEAPGESRGLPVSGENRGLRVSSAHEANRDRKALPDRRAYPAHKACPGPEGNRGLPVRKAGKILPTLNMESLHLLPAIITFPIILSGAPGDSPVCPLMKPYSLCRDMFT